MPFLHFAREHSKIRQTDLEIAQEIDAFSVKMMLYSLENTQKEEKRKHESCHEIFI